MNKEQAQQFYDSSPKPELQFSRYYKYTFDFVGENDAKKLSVSYGGNSDDIYRFNVDREAVKAPENFDGLINEYYSVTITNKETGEKFEDYHY